MAHVNVLREDVDVQDATLVEGLPGVGLVGKIATDHLVETFEMTHYASLHCESIPPVAVYSEGDTALRPPVRLHADEERGLVALQSDVPIHPRAADEFASCFSDWSDERGVTPIFLSGLPREKGEDVPAMYGVAVGDAAGRLDDVDIEVPTETGLISGPTGALLNYAVENDRPALGLVVESDPRFPDPEAARALLTGGISPLTGVEVPTDNLVDRAEEIREAKDHLAERMQEADEESSQARPLGMYQ